MTAHSELTPAVEKLAFEVSVMSLRAVGYTLPMIERIWNDDPEGRKAFLDFAEIHAARIITEYKESTK